MRFLIAHGFRGSPQQPGWLLWLAALLEKSGFPVHVPQFPNPDEPNVEEWVATIDQELKGNYEEAVLIGHSLGGLAILKALEKNQDMAATVVLVGTPIDDVGKEQIVDFLPPFDWAKLRKNVAHFAYFYSEDDPYVPFEHAIKYAEQLPGDIQKFSDKGHFEQPEFPELPIYLENIFSVNGNFNW